MVVLRGTSGNDTLTGFAGGDRLYGRAGNDVLIGGAGRDVLHGGPGIDEARYWDEPSGVTVRLDQRVAITATGRDRLISIEDAWGSSHADLLVGSSGENDIWGSGGDDRIYGKGGDDQLGGYTGNDRIFGGGGDDFITGGEGNDRIRTGGGEDTLNLMIVWDGPDDTFWRPSGVDIVDDFRPGQDRFLASLGYFDRNGRAQTLTTDQVFELLDSSGDDLLTPRDEHIYQSRPQDGGAGIRVDFGGALDQFLRIDTWGTRTSEVTLLGVTSLDRNDFWL